MGIGLQSRLGLSPIRVRVRVMVRVMVRIRVRGMVMVRVMVRVRLRVSVRASVRVRERVRVPVRPEPRAALLSLQVPQHSLRTLQACARQQSIQATMVSHRWFNSASSASVSATRASVRGIMRLWGVTVAIWMELGL